MSSATAQEHGAVFGDYIAKMRALWDEHAARGDEGPEALAEAALELLTDFIARTTDDDEWMQVMRGERPDALKLYEDDKHGFIQMAHLHVPSDDKVPHDHGPHWVLYGVVEGAMDVTTYRRKDGGGTQGPAELELVREETLADGGTRSYYPTDIHATGVLSPDGAIILRFLSGDLSKVQRLAYDLDSGQVTTF